MLSEQRKVLAMLRDGKVSVEEAEQMLDLLTPPENRSAGRPRVDLVGESAAMKEVITLISKAARSDVPVLILGEAGTGKEVVARAIHLQSSRSKGPFVALDCTALSDILQRSELFGYERNAFTGAVGEKAGLLETANGGSLFLVGIHALTSEAQGTLGNMLKGRGYTRLGGSVLLYPDVRIIAATEVDLAKEVAEGRFRPDVYDQLSIVTLVLPPLRDHKEDIPALAHHFLDAIAERDQRTLSLSPETLDHLIQYDWPKNVRQLKNVLQRAAVSCDENVIRPQDLSVAEA
jgi:DNA-binding NtrC family response regulator